MADSVSENVPPLRESAQYLPDDKKQNGHHFQRNVSYCRLRSHNDFFLYYQSLFAAFQRQYNHHYL